MENNITYTINNLAKDLQKIREFLLIIQPIKRSLDKLEFDLNLKNTQCEIFGIIDFSDLFRYLHPILDSAAYQDPCSYSAEQLAIEYLFTKPQPFLLYLVDVYRQEYLWSLKGTSKEIEAFAQNTRENIKRRVAKWDKEASKIFEQNEALKNINIENQYQELAFKDRLLLDVLFNNARAKMLQKGLIEYKKLIDDHKIIPRLRNERFQAIDFQEDQTEIDYFTSILKRLRPHRHITNKNDAKVFYLVQKLNKTYYNRRVFLYITSSRKVLQAFDSEYAIENAIDQTLFKHMDHVTAIRDPQYLLLRFLFESKPADHELFDFERFKSLVHRYYNAAKKLEPHYQKTLEDLESLGQSLQERVKIAISLQDKLEPMLSYIGRFGVETQKRSSLYDLFYKRIEMPNLLQNDELNEDSIRKIIKKAIDSPEPLIEDCNRNAKLLIDLITDLEISVVDTIYKPEHADLIYYMTISTPDDIELKNLSKSIIDALGQHELSGIKKAFKLLGELRAGDYSDCVEVDILASKTHRAMRSYNEALVYSNNAKNKNPNSLEAHFELSVCYRKIARSYPGKNHYFKAAWNECTEAIRINPEDPRVLKEMAMLIWYAKFREEKLWELPENITDEPESKCVSLCKTALEAAQKSPEPDKRLILALENDLAYYLMCRKQGDDLNEAQQIIEGVIQRIKDLSIPKGAIYDTMGVILLQKYRQTSDLDLLLSAGDYIEKGYLEDDTIKVRQLHLVDWAKEMRQANKRKPDSLGD